MAHELAIIKGVGYGVRDRNHPMLWFEVSFLGGGALICLPQDQANRLIKEKMIYNIKDMEGKPCIVDVEERGMVTFVGLF